MRLQNNPYSLPLILTAVIMAALGIYAFRRRQRRAGAAAFAGMLTAASLWSIGDAGLWASVDFAPQYFWLRFRYVGIVSVSVFWLVFAARYTVQDWWLTRRVRLLLATPPLISLLLAWTNEAHGLWWASISQARTGGLSTLATIWGIGFWGHAAYSYLLLLAGMLLFVRALVKAPQDYRGKVAGLVIGVVTPWVGNALFIFGVLPLEGLDITPFAFTISGIAFAWTILPSRAFDVLPRAYGAVVQELADGVIVVDSQERIVEVNPAALALLGTESDRMAGRSLRKTLGKWPELLDHIRAKEEVEIDLKLSVDGGSRPVGLRVSQLQNPQGDHAGKLVHLRDISRRVQTEAVLERTQRDFFAVVEDLEDAYFEVDRMGRFTHINQAFCNAIGSGREDLIGRSYRRIVHRDSVLRTFRIFAEVLKSGMPKEKLEFDYVTADGSKRNAELSISPILSGEGEIVGSRGIVRDVTDRNAADLAIRTAKETAEARAEELATLNRVASTVSGSLDKRQILGSISRELLSMFDSSDAGIGIFDARQARLEFVAVQSGARRATNLELTIEPNDGWRQLLDAKEPLVLDNPLESPLTVAVRPMFGKRNIRALLIAPLVVRAQSIGFLTIGSREADRDFRDSDMELAETVAGQVASAIENARLYAEAERARDAAERELEIGREIQVGFFPEALPLVPGWEIAAHFQAARQVAGDFYDSFELGDGQHIGLLIADVCDKGVGAALFMALFRSLLRAFAGQGYAARSEVWVGMEETLQRIVSNTNDYIANTHDRLNMFATMFFAVLDPATGVLHYVNAGHDAPFIVGAEGLAARLPPTGPAVGMLPGLEFRTGLFTLTPGDILLAYTDGAIDARAPEGTAFGEQRLLAVLADPPPSASASVDRVMGDLREHVGSREQFDDVTLLAVRRRVMRGNQVLELKLQAELANLPRCREFVQEACARTGVGEEAAFALQLAVDEACANVIEHAYVGQPAGPLKLIFEYQLDKVQIVLIDWGHSFRMDQVAAPDLWAGWQERPIGGLGLHLIRETMDELTYQADPDRGNRLTMGKFLS